MPVNINNAIAFRGTYKVDNQNQDSFFKFQEYAIGKELEEGVSTSFKEKVIKRGDFAIFAYKAEQTLIVPDYMDTDVETFCANNGISYKKYDTKDLLNLNSIISRIDNAPRGYRKVNVDVEKFEKLIKNQSNNYECCKNDYDDYYKGDVNAMFRNGEKIPATTLIINDSSGNQSLKRYVDYFGTESLNEDQIMAYFSQVTDKPDHCVYFALKDLGMKKIPVYVDNESFEAGSVLGLFQV